MTPDFAGRDWLELLLPDMDLGKDPNQKVRVGAVTLVGRAQVIQMDSWLELARLGDHVDILVCCRVWLYHLSWYVWAWHYDWKVDDLRA